MGWLNGPNSLKGWKNGKTELTFKDGGRYTYTEPYMIIKEILSGKTQQVYYDHATFTDHTNNLEADLHYYPTSDNSYRGMIGRGAKGLVGGIAGKLWGSSKAKEEEKPKDWADEVQIKIYQVSDNIMDKSKPNKIEVCSGNGRWLSHLIMDNKVVWRIEEQVPQW